ncbi:MAG: TQO small subunit DoxD [Candidatus Bathyarchaeia archaeon]
MDTTGPAKISGNPIRPASLLWPLRIFMGFTFLYAGLQHLTDPSYFDPSMAGYIGKLVVGYATGSPIHAFLIGVVEPSAVSFGYSVAIGECLIGIAVLTGFLFRIAAFAGLLLNFTFYLSATWNAFPFYFGSDIVFVMCWLTLLLTGPQPKYSVDSVLATRYRSLSWLVPKPLQVSLQTNVVKPITIETPEVQVSIPSKATLYPNQVREINNAFDRIKRQFILHRETQTMLEFVRAFVISLGVDRNDAVRILSALQNILTRRPTEGATTKLGDALTQ